jgi:hypothetical protein
LDTLKTSVIVYKLHGKVLNNYSVSCVKKDRLESQKNSMDLSQSQISRLIQLFFFKQMSRLD